MCSVGDDDYDNQAEKTMRKESGIKLSETCNKCRVEKSCVVLRGKDAYCKNCFLIGTIHKFKASLGKYRLIQTNDRVLVWYKVGHPSTSLLHFLRSGLDLMAHKRLRFQPLILFIDDQYHLNVDERKLLLEQVKKEVSSFDFELHCISFADYITDPKKLPELVTTNIISEDDKEKLDYVINKKASKTNKNDIKRLLRRQLLIDVAKYYKCKFVFTPEISVDIASDLLSNVSLGRGSHISIDTGFCDDRDTEVKILKPLRLFDMKELAFYNNHNNLEPLSVRQIEVNPYSSVQDLMTKFVTDLQVNYPATVTTILKTGDKLSLNKHIDVHCRLCKGPIPEIGDQLTSQQSTNFSHLVSNEFLDYGITRQERFQNISDKFDQNSDVNDSICYSCSSICNDICVK
ncbi:unnamed protein product [Psylliodes chrysocephalus]|uniref:Cytoplasmic tRNA 2-thiolation protein 2 n=1 Tax=Psylliodes chrysocephalus TaxID=3402493 RepID=A0A9P0CNY0_9CUCU|nr:unnamed protein product [Psylliodes chrysocephala]